MPKPHGYVETIELPLGQIVAEDWFEDKELTAALAEVGQLHHVIVWKTGDEKFALATGRGRLASAKALGWPTLTADVYEGELAAMAAVALAEGVRRDNPVSEAAQIAMLKSAGKDPDEIRKVSGFSVTQQEARLDLLRLPANVRSDLIAGRMRASAAKALLKLPDEEHQLAALERSWELNREREKPYDYPTVKDVKAAVREERGKLQPVIPVPPPPDMTAEDVTVAEPDPAAVAAAVRRVYEETAPDGALGDAYVAVITDLEKGAPQ